MQAAGQVIVKVTHTHDHKLYKRAKRELNFFKMFHKSKRVCNLINGTFKDAAHGVPATCICVLEMFEQGTVRTLLDKGAPKFTERLSPDGPSFLRFKHVVAMAKDVSDGLQCMHQMNIIHRDIKPANICVELVPGSSNLRYTIIDLGSAVSCVDAQKEKKTMGFCGQFTTEVGLKLPLGTVPFMSPEHLDPDRYVDCRSDIFSLGVTIYHCLSGSFPFVQPHPVYDENQLARELFKIYASAKEAEPLDIPLAEKRARDKEVLIEIVTKTLRKEPAERFESAVALKENIEQRIDRCRARIWTGSVKGWCELGSMVVIAHEQQLRSNISD